MFDALGMKKQETEVGADFPPQFSGQLGGARPQTKGFAASTAEATGMTKRSINQQLARAEALGDKTLAKVTGTSLDSGAELDALVKLAAPVLWRGQNPARTAYTRPGSPLQNMDMLTKVSHTKRHQSAIVLFKPKGPVRKNTTE